MSKLPNTETMKHVMFYAPGDIRLEQAPIPVPGPGEVVIKNKVTLTCGTDVKTYKRGYRYEPPFGFGHEASGTVYLLARVSQPLLLEIELLPTTQLSEDTAITASAVSNQCAST